MRSTGGSGRGLRRLGRGASVAGVSVLVAVSVGQGVAATGRPVAAERTRVASAAGYVLYSVDQNGVDRQVVATVDPALFDPVGSGGALGESGGLLGRSPDGKHVLVAGPLGVVLVDLDGSDPVTLSPPGLSAGPTANAAFSPDGSLVAFSVTDLNCAAGTSPHDCVQLYVARTAGSDVRLLATNADFPSWSADSRWIAYEGELNANGDIDVVHPDGSGLHPIAKSVGGPFGGPKFAPTGNRVAYACPTIDQHSRLCISRADGSTPRLRIPANLYGPLVWSPDGRKIAGSGALNYSSDLAVLTIATRQTRNLTQSPQVYIGIEDTPLAWSADSSRIAFQRTCDAGLFAGPLPKGACLTTVWAIGLGNRLAKRLTHDDRVWRDVRWTKHRLTYFAATP